MGDVCAGSGGGGFCLQHLLYSIGNASTMRVICALAVVVVASNARLAELHAKQDCPPLASVKAGHMVLRHSTSDSHTHRFLSYWSGHVQKYTWRLTARHTCCSPIDLYTPGNGPAASVGHAYFVEDFHSSSARGRLIESNGA